MSELRHGPITRVSEDEVPTGIQADHLQVWHLAFLDEMAMHLGTPNPDYWS